MKRSENFTSYTRIICRIRKPIVNLNYTNPILNNNYEYSLLSTPKEGNLVLALDTPLTGKVISSSLKSLDDFAAFISCLDKTPVAYAFDSVFGECSSQEDFYNREAKALIQRIVEGVSSTVILYGPSGYCI